MYPYMYAPTLYVLHTQMYVLNANTRPPLGSLHAYQLFPIDDEQGHGAQDSLIVQTA